MRWLVERVEPGALCPARIWDQLIQFEIEDLAGFSVYAGHFGVDLGDYIGATPTTITMLRDPRERTLSHYLHVKRDIHHPSHARVAGQTLEQFLQDKQNWPMIENFQARYLIRSGLDMHGFRKRYDGAPEKSSKLSTTSEDVRYLYDKAYVRDTAMETIARCRVVGTTAHVERFLERVAAILPERPGPAASVPAENIAPNRDALGSLDAPVLDLIDQLTTIDQSLYEMARDRDGTPVT
jgi:hypothetical protein